MDTILIESRSGGYKISDGTMANRHKAYYRSYDESMPLNEITDEFKDIVPNALHEKDASYHLKECSIRWLGVWNQRVEVGYEGIRQEDGIKEIGKLYFDNAEQLYDRLKIALLC